VIVNIEAKRKKTLSKRESIMTTTTTTTRPKRSGLCACACSMMYLVALAPLLVCQGFQLQRQQHLSLLSSSSNNNISNNNNNNNNNNNRWYSSSSSSSSLSVGADYFQEDHVLQSTDIGIDAALGSVGGAHYVSEYERDADFYKRRNEAYYYSLKDKDINDNNNSNNNTDNDDNKDVEIVEPSLLKASHSSFKHIESLTNSLLTTNPLVAIAIFAVSGVLIAYLSGFFFLEGYIENWNPVENDMIPYWNDAEIHTIQRALPPP